LLEYVRKVSSRFEYFLQIFTPEPVLVLKVVVLDAKLNSTSNGDIFKERSLGKKRNFGQNTGFGLVYSADIHS
jgi:hypothetical protein